MMKQLTPRTEDALYQWSDGYCTEVAVDPSFARQLETELNETKAALEREQQDCATLRQMVRELRDALRRLCEEWAYQEKQGNVPPDRIEATFATDAITKANQLLP